MISKFFILHDTDISCQDMATWSIQKLLARAGTRQGILGKAIEGDLLQTSFVIKDFGSN